MTLAEIGAVLGAGRDAAGDPATGWSIDSRTVAAGDVFFALAGGRQDGHEYVTDAFERGAVAVIVRRNWTLPPGWPVSRTLFRVDDPALALAELAAHARRRWGGKVVAVTGSNAKTTTKDTVAALLATRWRTAKTAGNLNNELGLPLTILRIPDDAEVAVLEMGMNHAGEIRRLARIARPDIGVVTNVSPAHLGNFESIDGVAAAKRELIAELPAAATAVLNADDERVREFAAVHPGPSATFGFSAAADYRATEIETTPGGARFRLVRRGARGAGVAFASPLLGRHNVLNVLAALAVAGVLGLPPAGLRRAVAGLEAAPMRGRVVEAGGLRFLDDCYNSNPAAVKAMLAALTSYSGGGRRVAVLGEMRELGAHSKELHREVGRAAAGVDLLVGVAGDAREMLAGAVEAGLAPSATEFFEDAAAAGEALPGLLSSGDTVLFKASRGVGLELALERATRWAAGRA